MGNQNVVKDPNIEIFLELKQLIHPSDSKIKGCIYIEVKEYSLYSDLVLKIDCFEKTQYDLKRDKNKQPLKQERTTYYEQLMISQFLNGIYKGHYEFPFSFKLPQNIPGSLILSKNDSIRYRITAYLQSNQPTITNQMHSRQVWILQKFRGIPEPIINRQIKEAKCCMFGYGYGSVQTILEFQSNVVQPGQKVKLKLEINAHRMNTSIKKISIRLLQKNLIVTNGNKQQKEVKQLFSFDFNQNKLEKGQTRKMQKYVIFPVDLDPTAIGQILTRYYVIQTKLCFDSFSQISQQRQFFVLSNKDGTIEQNKPFPKPKKWRPIKHDRKQFTQLKKYEYKPHQFIPFHNQSGEKINNLDAMKQIQFESSRRLQI